MVAVELPPGSLATGRSSSALSDSEDDFKSHIAPLLDGPVPSSRRRRRLLAWVKSGPRMLLRAVRRQPRSFARLLFRYLLFFILFLAIATPILFPSYTRYPAHYTELRRRCQGADAKSGCANPNNEKVFITVSLYDQKGTVAGGMWGENVLELIRLIGEDNTFLSIYENDSGPDGEQALEEFKRKVPCKHRIVSEEHVAYSLFPHITMPDGTQRLKRLAYLSEMRNRALYPLDQMGDEDGIVEFDKVLFLNDAVFVPTDAAHLLFNTNLGPDGRTHYLTTCSLDYDYPAIMYDLYAQRDSEGFSSGLPIFPYFSREGSATSRSHILAQGDAVPVKSCWGGMVAMQASWVQNRNESLPTKDWQAIAHHVIDPDHPKKVSAPIRFRHEPELFFDACECCLFLSDVSAVAEAANAPDKGVFVNPYVRVAYSASTLRWERLIRRWERLFAVPQAVLTWLIGLPTHNPHRTVREGDAFSEEIYTRQEGWKMVERTGRSGLFCGVREMQLVVEKPRDGGKNYEDYGYADMHLGEQQLYFPM